MNDQALNHSTLLYTIDSRSAQLRGSFENQIRTFSDRQTDLHAVLRDRINGLEIQVKGSRDENSQIINAINLLRVKIQTSTAQLQELQSLNARLLERISTVEFSNPVEDKEAFASIIKAEVQNVMMSFGTEILEARTTAHESFSTSARKVSEQVGKDLLRSKSSRKARETRASTEGRWTKDAGSASDIETTWESTTHRWNFSGRLGSLTVTLNSTWPHGREFVQSSTVIKAVFRPASWVPLVGITTSLILEAGHRGFYKIQPSIAWFSVLPEDSPIFSSAKVGDLDHVRYLLVNGLASPFDQDPEGWTPLHVSFPESREQLFY